MNQRANTTNPELLILSGNFEHPVNETILRCAQLWLVVIAVAIASTGAAGPRVLRHDAEQGGSSGVDLLLPDLDVGRLSLQVPPSAAGGMRMVVGQEVKGARAATAKRSRRRQRHARDATVLGSDS